MEYTRCSARQMDQQRIHYLISGFLTGNLSAAEKAELDDFLKDPANRETFVAATSKLTEMEEQAAYDESLEPVLSRVLDVDRTPVSGGRTVRFRFPYWRVAAAVVLAAGIGGYWYWSNKASQTPQLAKNESTKPAVILPGSNKATLILEDGTTVPLDSTGHQTIRQGNTLVQRNNGQLLYSGQPATAKLSYNILATPKGGQFQVVLPDGTKVWLNAASRLKYPVAFAGNERLVELEGEAYFETVKDAHKPFKVKAGGFDVQVLGTSFDIMAYKDEKNTHTTLISGAVKVASEKESKLLQPGQQAVVNANADIGVSTVNTDEVIAWKNGYFSFRDADIAAVMRQLERWYDVTVSYPSGIPKGTFSGEMGRGLTLAEALKILEQTNVNFRIEEGRHIVILP
ncbi:FecR domain-containing protein [Chitinophaga filiformis]|uniref:FecR family protein n=1 Tax=Chitinophaga filiformis TaxID=104663 RepID=UPI001F36EA99|nr:FecR family protein [Chitinophaga filiformis]MCF6407408.1 FecR domain-containing protein [Chitinophaga filiformis]